MSEHKDQADRLEAEVDQLEHRSDALGEEIDEAREDWERKKADDSVPGAVENAVGDASDQDEDPPPESQGPG